MESPSLMYRSSGLLLPHEHLWSICSNTRQPPDILSRFAYQCRSLSKLGFVFEPWPYVLRVVIPHYWTFSFSSHLFGDSINLTSAHCNSGEFQRYSLLDQTHHLCAFVPLRTVRVAEVSEIFTRYWVRNFENEWRHQPRETRRKKKRVIDSKRL